MAVQCGWFYLADLNPRQGTEPGKTRPVLVIQTDLLNQVGHPSSLIIPITTNLQDEAKPLRVTLVTLVPKLQFGNAPALETLFRE